MKAEKKENIIGASALVMLVMFSSKILGFLRQTLIADIYGSNLVTDIYFTSSDFMIGVSGAITSAFTTALVSHYIKLRVEKGRDSANRTASNVLVMFVLFGTFLCLLMIACAPLTAKLLCPKYTPAELAVLAKYLRFYSLAFIFSAFQAILAAILNANNSFVPGKLYGLVLNPLAIAMILLFSGKLGIDAVVIAYIAANIIQIFVLICFCRPRFSFRPSGLLKDEDVKRIILIALPLLLANLLMQCNNVVDKVICNLMGEGFASAYSYAYTLEQFVTAILTVSVSLVLYSKFSNFAAKKDAEGMEKSFRRAVAALLLLLLPITSVVIVSAGDIVNIVYLRGNFTAENAEITRHALIGFAAGFPVVAVREMYIKVHFSYQNTKIPMVANGLSVFLNAALSVLLAWALVSMGFDGIFGVTVSTSLAAFLPIAIMNHTVRGYLPGFRACLTVKLCLQLVLGCVACVVVTLLLNSLAVPVLLRFVFEACGGMLAFYVLLLLFRNDELLWMLAAAKRRALGILKK